MTTTGRRARWGRASVRLQVEGQDAVFGHVTKTWAHLRYQRLLSLAPLSARARADMQRTGHDADWRAKVRAEPTIPDGARLVLLDDGGAPVLWLDVVKVSVAGRLATVLLRETNEVQS